MPSTRRAIWVGIPRSFGGIGSPWFSTRVMFQVGESPSIVRLARLVSPSRAKASSRIVVARPVTLCSLATVKSQAM